MILEALLHKGPLTMSELCDAALITNASMTAAIDRLEERAFVERIADKQDRRVRRVQLTAQGAALIKRLYVRHERDLDEVMSGIPPAERAELRRGSQGHRSRGTVEVVLADRHVQLRHVLRRLRPLVERRRHHLRLH